MFELFCQLCVACVFAVFPARMFAGGPHLPQPNQHEYEKGLHRLQQQRGTKHTIKQTIHSNKPKRFQISIKRVDV